MGLLSGRVRTPADFRRLLGPSERVLAIGSTETSSVIATQLGLWLPAAAEAVDPSGPGWRRIGWADVVKATWTDNGLEVLEGDTDPDGVVVDRPPVLIRFTEPRNLPAVVRTRVENSIVRSEQVPVPGGTGRVVARRVPGRDGISWTARRDTGTPDGPGTHAVLAEYRRRAEATSAELS
ncbi:hypothetical protein M6D93_14355 [Jatrophihabitans telluris]|uniref:SRPBCC family protein n=1 Tax=Jatrophihabitans telluris TaxID=2038343 RepID=A0ABY4QVF5_9ACTN|nr:hypothetical protein [Jatrophihabitans telluris]UQX87475.1 hypothetical protein M6D93_14355 [Jatrophihabitans telluris]